MVAGQGSMQEELGSKCKCKGSCISNHCVCKKAGFPCTNRCYGKAKSSVVCKDKTALETNSKVRGARGRKRATTTMETAD
jgi:hypothetical protein